MWDLVVVLWTEFVRMFHDIYLLSIDIAATGAALSLAIVFWVKFFRNHFKLGLWRLLTVSLAGLMTSLTVNYGTLTYFRTLHISGGDLVAAVMDSPIWYVSNTLFVVAIVFFARVFYKAGDQ
jgi:hypothetical protein